MRKTRSMTMMPPRAVINFGRTCCSASVYAYIYFEFRVVVHEQIAISICVGLVDAPSSSSDESACRQAAIQTISTAARLIAPVRLPALSPLFPSDFQDGLLDFSSPTPLLTCMIAGGGP
jgi:hypothetical protein